MTFKTKQLIVLLIFALLSVAVYQGFFRHPAGTDYEPFTKGYALTEVVMRSTDDNGQVVTEMRSPNMTHYLDKEQTLIEQPRVQLFTSNNTWLLQSPSAVYQRHQQSLYFPDNVSVASQQDPKVVLESSQLSVDLNTREATTAAEISLVQPGGWMQGVGAHILFNNKQIEILKDVYAEFQPR